ncbi:MULTISPECIES: lipopolysaccharide assembly protein LapB [unclassified Massilia]|uniref:tetratricopeptide repeat protein n=1 Tax=unclassified Massilia TaxID=2609279 RepID=UPI002105618B|nr:MULTISPECIES: hypothetical protein [unclassified Massilia]UTY59316.1 hypothetical protein HPQ68_20330 [Massilia sp. erpn]
MNNGTLAMLDQAELFQLALNASANGDSASTIAYLKEAVARSDASAHAHYLLGAEYAQIKLYTRAIDEMEAALAIDPGLAAARLQLAMLWLGQNDGARAAVVLGPLQALGEDEALRHFGQGLELLIGGDNAGAIASLERGIALNVAIPPLNGDMQRIIAEVQALSQAPQEGAAAADEGGQHILLSAYSGNQQS